MFRFIITTTVVLAALFGLGASDACATTITHFSDGFETSDGHNTSGSTVPNNGWITVTQQAPIQPTA